MNMRSPESFDASPRPVLVLMTSFVHGGAERHTITLVNHFAPRRPLVLAYLKPPESLLPSVDTQHVRVVNLQARKGVDDAAVQRLAELIDEVQPSLVLCVNAYPLAYAHMARKRSRHQPLIGDVYHTTLMRTWREQLEMAYYRLYFWRTDHLVFVCHNQRQHWRKRGLFARHNHVMHNGVDAQHFAPVSAQARAQERARWGLAEHDRVVGISAVLRPEKAHELLLQAVAAAHAAGMPWKVLIIGDGIRRPEVEAEIARLALAEHVVITGLVPDVRPALGACDVVSLVSVSETFSIASIEAMAMGKPMIMSRIGGAEEQVTPGVEGELFTSRNVGELTQCLQRCWPVQATQAMGQRARERVMREFSQQAMLTAYEGLFAQAEAQHQGVAWA